MKFRDQGGEVLLAQSTDVQISAADLDEIKIRAHSSTRLRARICTHSSQDDKVHEMLIAIAKGAYIRPHRHVGKTESYHLIEGRLDLIVFADAGSLADVIKLGDPSSGLPFFYRHAGLAFHTVLPRSNIAIFHETTTGPFAPNESLYAPWAPDASDVSAVSDFLARLESSQT